METRTSQQVRSHAQKYFRQIAKHFTHEPNDNELFARIEEVEKTSGEHFNELIVEKKPEINSLEC